MEWTRLPIASYRHRSSPRRDASHRAPARAATEAVRSCPGCASPARVELLISEMCAWFRAKGREAPSPPCGFELGYSARNEIGKGGRAVGARDAKPDRGLRDRIPSRPRSAPLRSERARARTDDTANGRSCRPRKFLSLARTPWPVGLGFATAGHSPAPVPPVLPVPTGRKETDSMK